MKKIVLLISFIILLGGCYNYKELNHYAIATGMAIDYDEEKKKYEVSLLISNSPKSGTEASSGYQTVVYSGKGTSIYDAIKEIGLISPKQIYIGHLSIVILSEEAAKEGLLKSLDFLLEEPRSKKNFYVALAKDEKAKNILSITTPLTDFPSQTLADNLKSTDYLQGAVVAIDFNTLVYYLINDGIDPSLNGFKIVGDEDDGAKASNIKTNLPKAYVKLTNLGIFKDDKFIKWTDKNESRGINIMNDSISEFYVETKCKDGNAVIDIENLETNLTVSKDGVVTAKVKGAGLINEITCDVDLSKQEEVDKIEKKAEKKIRGFMKDAINVSKENNTDLFGIGLMYYQNYPKKYKKIDDWYKYFNKLEFKLDVNIDLNHTGSVQQSIERIKNEKDY